MRELDLVYLVDELSQQVSRQHPVRGVLEYPRQRVTRISWFPGTSQFAQRGQQVFVDQPQEWRAGHIACGRPRPPPQAFGQDGAVALLERLAFLFEVVERFEEQQPGQLGETVQFAVETRVLAHDLARLVDHSL